MKLRNKAFLALVAVMVLVGSTFVTAAGAPRLQRSQRPVFGQRDFGPALQACSKMQAGDVFWVDEEGEEVDGYESGVAGITAAFEYNCVPKKTKIVSVWYYEGEEVWSDSEPLKTSKKAGTYSYGIATTDESALDEGEWGVEFFNNKTALTSGTVVVGEGGGGGGEDPAGDTVEVTGFIGDKKTKKPIKGAVFIVLNPGTDLDTWFENDQPDEDIFTMGTADKKGLFVLESELEIGEVYSVIAGAKGYKPMGGDDFEVTEEDSNPLELQILLSK